MILPSKFVSFKESSISKFPAVLKRLEKCDVRVTKLYAQVKSDVNDKDFSLDEFLDVLDCLFILKKITLVGEEIHRVN